MMNIMMRTIVSWALFWVVVQAGDRHWTYSGEYGPSHWPSMFTTCSRRSQSPVNVDMDGLVVQYDESLTADLSLVHGTEVDNYYMVNNGHTVYVDMQSAQVSLFGARLPRSYRVVGPHFHWGSSSITGSEHTIDGKHYPLEMHIVTYDEETYGTLTEAVGSGRPGAIAVVGILFHVSVEDNPALAPIIDNIVHVQRPDKLKRHPIEPFELNSLLPSDTSEYLRYAGSLTTPSCEEVVTWTLLMQPQHVSERQLTQFRTLLSGDSTPLVDNYRPVQPLNGRAVYKSFQSLTVDFAAHKEHHDHDHDDDDDDVSGRGAVWSGSLLVTVLACIATVML